MSFCLFMAMISCLFGSPGLGAVLDRHPLLDRRLATPYSRRVTAAQECGSIIRSLHHVDISQIPVVGKFVYRDADATPAAGETIEFFCRTQAVVDGDTITLPRALRTTLTDDGEIPAGFTLPTVDEGVYYTVLEDFDGGRPAYTILVLPTDTEINLATVAPVVPVDPLVSYATNADLDALAERVDDLTTVVEALDDPFPGALNGEQWDTTTRLRVGDLDYPAVGVVISSQSVRFEAVSGYSATLLGPAGVLASDAAIRLPAESGTIALLGDIPDVAEETAIVVGTPSSVAGVLTLDFDGKPRVVFAVTLTENVTSVLHTNVPSGVFLEKEVHYTQGGAGTYTVAQPASHKALGGSDTVVATTVGKVTVQSASSVDSGTTWRYAMQESA